MNVSNESLSLADHENEKVGYSPNETTISSINGAEDNDYDNTIKLVFEGILLGIVGSFGLFGNTAAIVMFTRIKRQTNFHRLMIMLAIFDTILVFFNILIFLGLYIT